MVGYTSTWLFQSQVCYCSVYQSDYWIMIIDNAYCVNFIRKAMFVNQKYYNFKLWGTVIIFCWILHIQEMCCGHKVVVIHNTNNEASVLCSGSQPFTAVTHTWSATGFRLKPITTAFSITKQNFLCWSFWESWLWFGLRTTGLMTTVVRCSLQ